MSGPIASFDEQAIKDDIRELVRQTVEDTINAQLDEEADLLVNAERYERTAEREAYRAGHYKRSFATTSGASSSRCLSSRAPGLPRRSSSATSAARSRSRRPSWRCTSPA